MMQFKSANLKTRFILTSVLLVILCSALSLAVVNIVAVRQAKDESGRVLAESAFHVADRLDREMWSRQQEVGLLTKLEIFRHPERFDNVRVILDRLQTAIPAFAWIGLTDPSGRVLVSTGGILTGESIASRPVYREALGGPFVGDVHEAVLLAKLLPNPTGEQMKFVDLSAPVLDENNALIGILATHLSWNWVGELDKSFIKPMLERERIELYVVSRDGTILLGPRESLGNQLDLAVIGQAKSSGPSWSIETWPDGQRYLTAAAFGGGHMDYQGLGWTVVARQETRVAHARIAQMERFIVWCGALLCLVVSVVGAYIARKITAPLGAIVESARQLRDGQTATFPEYRGIPDIETLSSSLREMLDSLRRTRAERDDMKELASLDRLTGLPNRLEFETYLTQIEGETPRRNQAYGVLYLDLDGFKPVNDNYGHDAGDFVLKTVAVRLRGCLRQGDRLARIGGDEFVVLMLAERDRAREEIEIAGNRIIGSINNDIFFNAVKVSVGCSIGACLYPNDAGDVRLAVKLADTALYRAKNLGKNKLVIHDGQGLPPDAHSGTTVPG